MEPIRIQRKRIKGWTMPENTVYVGRPTKWGNPYSISVGRSHSLKFYRTWLEERLKEDPHFLDDLKDKNLACWCKLSQPCHVDVLLEKLKSYDPAKPEPAKSDHVCRNKVGTLNHLVSETGGGFTIVSMGKIGDEDKKSDFVGSVKMQTAKDIFSELDKVINNPESMIDTESRLKYTEIKQKYIKV